MAADIVLADCIVQTNHNYQAERIYGANICIDCKNACGGCEWSEVDPQTKKVRFAPVPGWTAKSAVIGKSRDGEDITSFHVMACPKFRPMRRITPRVHAGSPPRPVIATDVRGEVREFASIGEAARATGAREPNITAACNGRIKTAGGYKWRYEDETDVKTKV